MLIKLLKYELKATGRIYLFIYCLLAALTGLTIISFGASVLFEELSVIAGFALLFTSLAMLLLMFGALAVALIASALRFRSNLMGSEGYIMHTLPVKTESLIISKTAVSVFWTIATYIVMGICGFAIITALVIPQLNQINIPDFYEKVREMALSFSDNIPDLIFYLLFCIVWFIRLYLTIFGALAIGYSFNSFRKVKFFAALILLSYAFAILTDRINGFTDSDVVMLILNIIISAIMFGITDYFLKRRLNLQ